MKEKVSVLKITEIKWCKASFFPGLTPQGAKNGRLNCLAFVPKASGIKRYGVKIEQKAGCARCLNSGCRSYSTDAENKKG